MGLFLGVVWGLLGAALVAWLVERQGAADLAAAGRGEPVDLGRGGDSSGAFMLCALFLIAAPVVLGRARGARGVIEGLGILIGAWVLTVASTVGLLLLRGY